MTYFFDTYAIIEIAKGSKSYEKFLGLKIITGVLNIGELYQINLIKHGKNVADEWFTNSNFDILEISPEIIVEAVYFRFVNKKKNMSLVDCVGYILSQKYNLKFLTGDAQFENISNVEFVK